MKTLNNILIGLFLFFGGIGMAQAQQTSVPHEADENGVYIFQATQYFEMEAGTDAYDGENWLQGTDETVGDYLYLENTTSDNRNEVSADREISPSVVYKINMPEAQTGFVWALINEGSKDGGRIYVNVNDLDLDKRKVGEFGSAAKSRISEEMAGQWQWILINNQANSSVVKAGENVIEVFKARPNLKIAKIAFTPKQEINLIINAPEVKVTENDGTNVTISWNEPTLTGELYDFTEEIITPKSFFYRVSIDGESQGDQLTTTSLSIPVADLGTAKEISVEAGHLFRKNSSSNINSYSTPTVISVDASSMPDNGGEDEGLPITDTPHEADKFGIYMFSATEVAEAKEGSAFGAQDFTGEKWLKGNDPEVGDYVYLENTTSDNRNETSSERYASPSLVYKINMTEAQTGYVWALVNEGSKDAGRIYVNVNDLDLDKRSANSYGSAARSRISDAMKGEWQWIVLNNQANSGVVKDGENVIEIFKARPNIKIAKIAFTPRQDINLILDTPMPRVTANDGTNITLSWDDPTITGDLYNNSDVIYDPKSYFYRVLLGGEEVAADLTAKNIQIPVADLTESKTFSLEVAHEFKKSSSSVHSTYSIPGEIDIDASSQPNDPGEEPDLEAPSVPTDLTSSDVSQNKLTLSWTASTDNEGVSGYQIIQNGQELPEKVTGSTSVTLSNLSPDTEYTFAVVAYDAAGNKSAASTTHVVKTEAVEQNPDGDYQDFIHQADENGIFLFEAVEFASNLPGTDEFEGQKWLTATDPEIGRYMYLSNTDTTTNSNKVSEDRAKSPRLMYQISMPEVQTGFIWALVQQGATHSGKLYGNVNDIDVDERTAGEYGSSFGSRISEDLVGKWQWILVGYQIRNNNAEMLKAGINEIELFMAYPDIKIAKLMYAPKQEILPIINPVKVRIQANDETTVTLSWDDPVLTGELYDYNLDIFTEKEFTYRVRLEGLEEEDVVGNEYVISKENLKSAKVFTIEAGHLFRKNSSSNALFYSMESTASVSADSQPDFEAPTAPTDLIALDVQGTNVALSWQPSTDNVGVLGYYIYQDGLKIQEVTSTSYKVGGLSVSTEYTFEVQAFDAAGNESDKSTALVITTNDEDEVVGDRPNVVKDVTASQVTASSFTVGWAPSNSLNGITAYYVFVRVKGEEEFKMVAHLSGEVFSFNLTGLEVGTEYEIVVRAEDGMGYVSENSDVISQKTSDAPLSVEDGLASKLIQKVYPNPSVSDVNIEFISEVNYQVIDLTGQTLTSGTAQKVTVDLPSGSYILIAWDKHGNKEATKLLCF
ncbi:fibronectin type III domain-containing protein [Flammeovirga sp. SubArs3]|uniref:fibronectin type III domain-containing protein n=1 Tax=Flammeovirga sp. SubArs3 TaxID=2995316 RepID=UPI00248AE46C|nr:fibronectin type III domain-containing protein [Flammeovirga sp. SubArs3]